MQLKRQTLLLTMSFMVATGAHSAAIAATNPLYKPQIATPYSPTTAQTSASPASVSNNSINSNSSNGPNGAGNNSNNGSNGNAPGSGGNGGAPSNSGALIQAIKINTDFILQKINNLPTILLEIKNNLLRTQVSGKTPEALLFTTQQYMDSMGQLFQYGIARNPSFNDSNNDNIDSFNNYLLNLQKQGFATSQSLEGNTFDSASFTPDKKTGQAPIEQAIPNVSALAYTNAIGLPPLIANNKPDPTWAGTYINAASGANFYHAKLLLQSDKITVPQKQYKSYFDLAYAVQSFNNYVLGKYILNNNTLSQNQSVLYRTASSSANYLSTIATEPMGYVLRDILLFQSQQYVLVAKLVELQRETLMAQTMTNALLIASNRAAESALYDKTLSR